MVAAIGSFALVINVCGVMSNRKPVSWYYETELLETTYTKFLRIPTNGTNFSHQSNIKATHILCGLGYKEK
jgi:hypothetical protein